MKYAIGIDPERSRASVVVSGHFDLKAIAQSMIDMGTYPGYEVYFGILIDLRAVDPSPPTVEELEAISRLLEGWRQAARGPLALLALPGEVSRMVRLSTEQAAARGIRMRSFHSLTEAEAWIARETRAPEALEAWRTVVDAVAAGDCAAVEAALRDTPALAADVDPAGVSLLRRALKLGHPEIAQRLGEGREDLDLLDASALGRVDRVRFLCDEDALRVGLVAPDGATPLWLAARFARADTVAALLRYGADANASGVDGRAPLQEAAERGDAAIVESLLAAGADPEVGAEVGMSPVELARAGGHVHVLERLVAARRR